MKTQQLTLKGTSCSTNEICGLVGACYCCDCRLLQSETCIPVIASLRQHKLSLDLRSWINYVADVLISYLFSSQHVKSLLYSGK